MIEISNSNGASSNADGALANGSNIIALDSTADFPSTGTIVFLDSLSQLQKLTYTANNTGTNRLSGAASSWTGTGTLLNDTLIEETSYSAIGSTEFIEINNSNGAASKADGGWANGADAILLNNTANFPSTGTIVFLDSLSELQELTYTVNSENRLVGLASSWTGTGTLLDETLVHETSYNAIGSTTFTEVAIS